MDGFYLNRFNEESHTYISFSNDSVGEGDLLYVHPNSTAFGFNLPPIKKEEHLVLRLPASTETAGMAFLAPE